jgi:hypothetical protein
VSESESDPPVGIWRSVRALGGYSFSEVIWPEAFFGALIGGGGTVAVALSTRVSDRVGAVGDLVGVAIGLLAVIFAALAIIVALPASRYLNLLGETPDGGMRVFLDPFLVAVGTQIVLVFLTVGYRLLAVHVPAGVEHAAFYALGFLFAFGILDIGALARQLVRHGVFRAAAAAEDAKKDNGGDGGRVHHLESRR